MRAALFLQHKIKRQLQCNGQEYIFKRYGEDEYHCKDRENFSEITVQGLYHVTSSYIRESNNEGGRMISKTQPMLLVLYDDGKKLEVDDEVVIGDNLYKIVAFNDVQNLKIAHDISLEEIVK